MKHLQITKTVIQLRTNWTLFLLTSLHQPTVYKQQQKWSPTVPAFTCQPHHCSRTKYIFIFTPKDVK